MRKLLLFGFCWLSVLGCNKEGQNIPKNIEGVYVGMLQRVRIWSDSDTAKISLTFSSGTWTGTSDKVKYPALCRGTYAIIGDSIIFENGCAWTAEFDWSLILSGKYGLKTDGNTIEISRDYCLSTTDTFTDKYKIKKQED
jgi:hypothetical protein